MSVRTFLSTRNIRTCDGAFLCEYWGTSKFEFSTFYFINEVRSPKETKTMQCSQQQLTSRNATDSDFTNGKKSDSAHDWSGFWLRLKLHNFLASREDLVDASSQSEWKTSWENKSMSTFEQMTSKPDLHFRVAVILSHAQKICAEIQ